MQAFVLSWYDYIQNNHLYSAGMTTYKIIIVLSWYDYIQNFHLYPAGMATYKMFICTQLVWLHTKCSFVPSWYDYMYIKCLFVLSWYDYIQSVCLYPAGMTTYKMFVCTQLVWVHTKCSKIFHSWMLNGCRFSHCNKLCGSFINSFSTSHFINTNLLITISIQIRLFCCENIGIDHMLQAI